MHAHTLTHCIFKTVFKNLLLYFQTITTPKKARLQGSSSFSDADDDILQVVSPDYTDERTESLMEQIKKLQVNFPKTQTIGNSKLLAYPFP